MSLRDFWERTAERFGEYGIRAVCNPTAVGWVNKDSDFLHRTCLTPFLENCRGSIVLDVGCGVGRWTSRLLDHAFDKNRLKIKRIKGVELALFLRPLFAVKKRIFRNGGLYTLQLSAKPFPLRMQIAKAIYYLLINLAIVFSLPLDLSLRDLFKSYSLNKLFIFEKI